MREKLMVIGAKGFVGQHLCFAIQDSKYTLSAVSKNGGRLGRIDTVSMDILSTMEIEKVIKRESPDVIINCAGLISVRGCEEQPTLAHQLNGKFLEKLANVSIVARTALICQLSTDAVFSGKECGAPFNETDTPKSCNMYGMSKLEGESVLADSGVPYQIVRTSAVIGDMPYPNGRYTFQRSLVETLKEKDVFYAMTDAINSPTDVKDVVGGVLHLIEMFASGKAEGIFHLAGPQPMTKYELARTIALKHNLNENLVQPTTRMQVDPNYPPNTSLSSKRLSSLGFSAKRIAI